MSHRARARSARGLDVGRRRGRPRSRGRSRGVASRRRPAVFVDRDGTLNRDVDYLATVRGLRLIPGAAEGVRRLRAAGFAVVVVTNQSGVARGRITPTALGAIHAALLRRLRAGGAALDGLYACPHHPEIGRPPWRRRCRCRKPAAGLVRRAVRELGLDLRGSYCVGDGAVDMGLAAATGARAVLVLTGHGRRTDAELREGERPAHVAVNFRAAAEWIIDDAARRARRRR